MFTSTCIVHPYNLNMCWFIVWLTDWLVGSSQSIATVFLRYASLSHLLKLLVSSSIGQSCPGKKNEAGGWNRRGQSRLAALYFSLNTYSHIYIYTVYIHIWRYYVHVFYWRARGTETDRNGCSYKSKAAYQLSTVVLFWGEPRDVYHPRFPMEKNHRRFHVGRWRRHIRKRTRIQTELMRKTCTLKWLKSSTKRTYSLINLHYCVTYSLRIQPPSQMMIGVYHHLLNARYLGSITILRR